MTVRNFASLRGARLVTLGAIIGALSIIGGLKLVSALTATDPKVLACVDNRSGAVTVPSSGACNSAKQTSVLLATGAGLDSEASRATAAESTLDARLTAEIARSRGTYIVSNANEGCVATIYVGCNQFTARCSAGDHVLGGGVATPYGTGAYVTASRPTDLGDGWFGAVHSNAVPTVYAICQPSP